MRERIFSSVLLPAPLRSEEHTSELQSQSNLVCRLLLEKKKKSSRRIRTRSSTSVKSCSRITSSPTSRSSAAETYESAWRYHSGSAILKFLYESSDRTTL